MRQKLLIFLLVSLAISVRCASDPKDDFSEFDSPEDFDAPPKPREEKQPQQQQKVETPTKPKKDDVIFYILVILSSPIFR